MAAAMLAVAKQQPRISTAIKQVTKTNFASALQQIKSHIDECDFIAVSSRQTGGSSSSWRRVLPIDTADVAYLKSKFAAETFQLFQFAVCPFSVRGSKVTAYPYNFHLFPRDELNSGMPSYSFSCQTSFLSAMAREGFDFNACIYEGISYLSRVQESTAKDRNPAPQVHPIPPASNPSIADSVFMGRIKSRVEYWRKCCKNKDKAPDGSLLESLRKLLSGGELYGSRPCTSIDVCNERQVDLVLEIVTQIGDDLVPLVVPDKGGAPTAVRVVLTSSNEDKKLLLREIKDLEEEQNLKVRGFLEVIDLVSGSQKPIITYNCLHDFTFIHSKFLAPLPGSLSDFVCSLRLAFPIVLDVNHLSKEIGPLRKAKNLSASLSYLKRQFFVPIELEFPQQDNDGETKKNHGHNVLKITSLFAKLYKLLRLDPNCQSTYKEQHKSIEDYANIFPPICTSLQEPADDEDVNPSLDNDKRNVSTDNLVFIWGFGRGVTFSELRRHLQSIHPVFSEGFELQFVDKTCLVIVFPNSTAVETLLKAIESGQGGSSALREMVSNGLKGAGYEVYKKVCKLGLWKAGLADSLDLALAHSETEHDSSASLSQESSLIYWDSELMIDLNDL